MTLKPYKSRYFQKKQIFAPLNLKILTRRYEIYYDFWDKFLIVQINVYTKLQLIISHSVVKLLKWLLFELLAVYPMEVSSANCLTCKLFRLLCAAIPFSSDCDETLAIYCFKLCKEHIQLSCSFQGTRENSEKKNH